MSGKQKPDVFVMQAPAPQNAHGVVSAIGLSVSVSLLINVFFF
jgi:hypothetical protein